MSEETKQTPETEAEAETEAPETQPETDETEAEAPEGPEVVEVEASAADGDAKTYEELEAEVADLKDKLLRAMAETENIRRRAARDKQDASKYAIAGFAREMVSVADNLGRALEHVSAEARAGDEAIDSLATGVEMTEKVMLGALERFGIQPIEALGKKFDHNLHEAMFEVPDPSQPSGTVVQEVEKGYMLADRLLRPARVGVSKGGPAAPNGDGGSEGAEAEDAVAAKEHREVYEKRTDSQAGSSSDSGGKIDEQF